MAMLVIRHKVKNYEKWRPEFDRHGNAQRSAGLTNPRVFRSSEDPSEVVIFFNARDTAKAKDFRFAGPQKHYGESWGRR